MGISLSPGGSFQSLRDALTPLNDSRPVTFERLISLAKASTPAPAACCSCRYLSATLALLAPDASASLVGLSRMDDVGHISRAVLEGVLMNLREILEVCVAAGYGPTRSSRPAARPRRALAAAAGRRARARGHDRGPRVRRRRVRGGADRRRRRRGLAGPPARLDGPWSGPSPPTPNRSSATTWCSPRTAGCTRRSTDVYTLMAAADGSDASTAAAVGDGPPTRDARRPGARGRTAPPSAGRQR